MSDSTFIPTKITFKPGYMRDGSNFSNTNSVDGLWNRFFNGRPRKMGGFSRFNFDIEGTIREIWTDDRDGLTNIHLFGDYGVQRVRVNQNTGVIYAPLDRTPVGYTVDPSNSWQVDQIYDSASNKSIIIACSGSNMSSIDSSGAGSIYWADPQDASLFAAATFAPGNPSSLTGGSCVVHPYAFYYGDDGYLTWSAPNDPFNLATASGGGGVAGVRISESKIIKGNSFRSGSAGPSALFWSLNSLVRASYIGGSPVFSYSTLADYISPLNPRSIVQYDSAFYWPDKGRFLTFNGTVSEIKNSYNLRWFYENLNWKYKSKCFGISMADWGEIWWCFPYRENTEPSHAIILNLREQCFYDTELPNRNRTAGVESQGYRYPLMASNYELSGGDIVGALWDHERGNDEVNGSTIKAIRAYFDTPFISLPHAAAGNFGLNITDFEPDIRFTNAMRVQLIGRVAPDSPNIEDVVKTFYPRDTIVHFDKDFRMIKLILESNIIGGSYIFGDSNLIYTQPSGQRNTR